MKLPAINRSVKDSARQHHPSAKFGETKYSRRRLIGIPGVYAAGGLLRGVLVDVSPWAPFTLSAVAIGLLCVTMTACYLPARRVLRIDPAPLLRQD